MSRRYDSRTTMFSPEGRLYQVEYAMEAIGNAGSAIGILSKDGVVLVGEKKVTSKLLQTSTSTEKMYKIDDHVAFKICRMPNLSKLRCITVDVTGTLMAYKGELGDYYCMAAKSVGLPCPDYKRVHEGFKIAYKEMARKYPCFGFAAKMPNIIWWRTCVRNSFFRAGYNYDEETFEKVFRRIYASFGSSAPYTVFPDSQPFLRWARDEGLKVRIVSNAEYRYQDVILPALNLNQGSEWDFGVFSGLEGVEKPDRRIYEIALERAGNVAPEEALHIGDSLRKDFVPAKSGNASVVVG